MRRESRARLLEPYEGYLADKIGACRDLSGRRLFRKMRDLGYGGCYSAVTVCLRTVRPGGPAKFERRFKIKPSEQAQVDFGEFMTEFADEADVVQKVHLFSFVLG